MESVATPTLTDEQLTEEWLKKVDDALLDVLKARGRDFVDRAFPRT